MQVASLGWVQMMYPREHRSFFSKPVSESKGLCPTSGHGSPVFHENGMPPVWDPLICDTGQVLLEWDFSNSNSEGQDSNSFSWTGISDPDTDKDCQIHSLWGCPADGQRHPSSDWQTREGMLTGQNAKHLGHRATQQTELMSISGRKRMDKNTEYSCQILESPSPRS